MSSQFDLYDDVAGLERYLNFPEGSLRNIPIYARKPAIDSILKVKEMESKNLFRPGLYYIVLLPSMRSTETRKATSGPNGSILPQSSLWES